ncbi:MAG: hypothetical protein A4E48_00116 [Methanosaeta sp. PtaU1.Bin060]|nr:MAG: hypothetical protein A4E48_00116 [Methanosaeta sp. PtaU1.Bin060]
MIDDICENKSFSASETRRLTELEEARGQLLRILEAEGQCIAVFAWGAISFPAELREELAASVGREIAALRLDDKIHIRNLDEEAADAAR